MAGRDILGYLVQSPAQMKHGKFPWLLPSLPAEVLEAKQPNSFEGIVDQASRRVCMGCFSEITGDETICPGKSFQSSVLYFPYRTWGL